MIPRMGWPVGAGGTLHVNAEMATLSAKPIDVFLNTIRYDAEEDFETEKCDVSFLAESEYLSI